MQQKKALITGITGQDGSYLAEFLLGKGYEVHGIVRRSSSFNTDRLEHLYVDPHVAQRQAAPALRRPRRRHGPARDPHPRAAGRGLQPRRPVARARQLRPAGLHRAVRRARHDATCSRPSATPGCPTRFYQASSSEMYGKVVETPQTETTPFHPRSPYACAKVFSYWQTVNYREAYDMFAVQRHPLQPREPPPRRDVRHAQDHPRRDAHQGRAAGQAVPRQPRREARLGLRRRLRRGDVADAAGGGAAGLRHRDGRDAQRPRVPRRGVRPPRAGLEQVRRGRPALLPPRRGRPAARRRDARRARSSAGRRR